MRECFLQQLPMPRILAGFQLLHDTLPCKTKILFLPPSRCLFRAHLLASTARLLPRLGLLRLHRLAFPPSGHIRIIVPGSRHSSANRTPCRNTQPRILFSHPKMASLKPRNDRINIQPLDSIAIMPNRSRVGSSSSPFEGEATVESCYFVLLKRATLAIQSVAPRHPDGSGGVAVSSRPR